MLDDDPLARHAHRPARQRDRGDHRHELGREADGQGQREQHGLQRRTMRGDADQQHGEQQEHHRVHDQPGKTAQPALEFRGWRTLGQCFGNVAERRMATGGKDECGRRAGNHRCAEKDQMPRIDASIQIPRCAGHLLFHGHRLAGERGLQHMQVACGCQTGVRRHPIPRGQPDQVARHQVAAQPLLPASIAADGGHRRNLVTQAVGCILGAVTQREIEGDTENHHGRDNGGADFVSEKAGDGGRQQQDDHQWIGKQQEQGCHRTTMAGRACFIRPIAGLSIPGFAFRQSRGRSRRCVCRLAGRIARRSGRCTGVMHGARNAREDAVPAS